MLPIVTKSVINSIKVQSQRQTDIDYAEQIIDDMENDGQKDLVNAIMSTSHDCSEYLFKKASDTVDHDFKTLIFANLVSISTSVYQSLKQQYVCDELE